MDGDVQHVIDGCRAFFTAEQLRAGGAEGGSAAQART